MYCPACGVKNDGSPLKCFICGFIMPTGQASADRALAGDPQRRTRTNGNGRSAAMTSEPFAAIGDRMLALILDRIAILALLTIPGAAIAAHWSTMDPRITPPLRAAGVALGAFVVAILVYHIVLEGLFGSTIGKGLLGLHVRNGSGEKWLASAIRNVARLIDSAVFYAVAFLVAAFSSKRQRLGDHLAGTVVIEQRVPWGARVALIFIWLAVVAGSLWIAGFLCPSCIPALRLPA